MMVMMAGYPQQSKTDEKHDAIVNTLSRIADLHMDISAETFATLAVLCVLEHGPQSGQGVFDVLHPLAQRLARSNTLLNVPLLHELMEVGLLELHDEGPAPARRGRVYALTAQGMRTLSEIRTYVRDAGYRALALAAADLDALHPGNSRPPSPFQELAC